MTAAAAERKRDWQLRRRYNLSLEAYKAIHAAQGGVCAICKEPETARDPKSGKVISLAVDHDHTTNRIRGLLCSRCNRAVGYFRDSMHTILAAAQYIARHRENYPCPSSSCSSSSSSSSSSSRVPSDA